MNNNNFIFGYPAQVSKTISQSIPICAKIWKFKFPQQYAKQIYLTAYIPRDQHLKLNSINISGRIIAE